MAPRAYRDVPLGPPPAARPSWRKWAPGNAWLGWPIRRQSIALAGRAPGLATRAFRPRQRAGRLGG
eukprot:2059770-Lingulodinium_polyedra.AAC.1